MEFSSKFISKSLKYATITDSVPAPLFRRKFTISNNFDKCAICICGLGFYELFINGINVTKGLLAPYISNSAELVCYDLYDITKIVNYGDNIIAVMLGNGMQNSIGGFVWDFDKETFRSAPKFALNLSIDDKIVLECDDKFKCHNSAIMFDDLRCGEHYNANEESDGWETLDYDDSNWDAAVGVSTPKGKAVICLAEPIVKIKELKVEKIIKSSKGFIYDFGVNNAGLCKLHIHAKAGQFIRLTYGEMVINGELDIANISFPNTIVNFNQCDEYVCKSNGIEEYLPHFTYHGFRYVYVEGIENWQAKIDLLTYYVYHSAINKNGEFICDNDCINRLQEITLRSDESNFYYFPTDCPQREKNGWTADAALSCEQLLLNYNASNSMEFWLNSIRLSQRNDGAIPGIIPTFGWGFEWGNGPAWDNVLIELPYQIFRYTGRRDGLIDNADAIYKYCAYMLSKIDNDGLLAFGLGDWCQVNMMEETDITTPLQVTDTIIACDILYKASQIFKELHQEDKCKFCLVNYNKIRSNFRYKYITDKFYINCYTQSAQAMAIYYNMFEQNEVDIAVCNLVKIIESENNHFNVGVLGGRVLFRVLAEHGYQNLSIKLITQDSFPSFKYNLNKGATTLWEGFNLLEDSAELMRVDGQHLLSLNHHFWGDISAFFYRYILGINVINAKLIMIDCKLFDSVTKASGKFINDFGCVEVNVIKEKDFVNVNINVSGSIVCKVAHNLKSKININILQ